jgi:hypothetical protein
MFKTVRESFKITNDNIIIATPLIFFSLISGLYLMFSANGSKTGIFFAVILFFLMTAAFISGWFFMITKAVKEPDIETGRLIAEFPSGVGEYFLSALGIILQTIIISMLIMISAFLAGKKFIGTPGVSYEQFSQAVISVEAMKTFVNSLSQEQLIKINNWNILMFFAMVINSFILMLYPAVVFFKKKNPFTALFVTFKDTFGHRFFKNAGIFLLIFILYMFISLCSMFAGSNVILHFIVTLVNFYYATFTGVLLFNYYYSNFIKIGSNIDTTV